MFGYNSGDDSTFGNKVAEYRNENLSIIQELKALIQFVNNPLINKLEKFDESEIVGFFGSQSAKQILSGLRFKPALLEHSQKLIVVLEEENEKFALYLQSLKKDGIDNHNSLSSILKTYNEKESALMHQIRTIVPAIQYLERLTIGIDEETLQHTTINFINMYNEFENLIKDKKGADVVFDAFKHILLFLHRYIDEIERFHTENTRAFTHVTNQQEHKIHAIKFADNFFQAGSGHTIVAGLNKILGKNIEKSYNDFDDELKTKADKFAKDKLGALLGEFEYTNDQNTGVKLKVNIGDIFKIPTNMKELKEKFEKLVLELSRTIEKDKKLKWDDTLGEKGVDSLRLKLINNDYKFIKNMMEEVFKKDDEDSLRLAKDIINKLTDIINDEGDSYDTFIDYQESNTFSQNGRPRTRGGGGGNDWFNENDKIDNRNDLNSLIQELINIINVITEDGSENFDEGGNWKSTPENNHNLTGIKNNLKQIAATLYSDESNNWGLGNIEMSTLKSKYEAINGLSGTFSRSSFNHAIAGLIELLNQISNP